MSWQGLTELKYALEEFEEDLKMAEAEYHLVGVKRLGQLTLSMPASIENQHVIGTSCLLDGRLNGMRSAFDETITLLRPYLGNPNAPVGGVGRKLGEFCREENEMNTLQTLFECIQELMDLRP
jgi:hypothetical protein